MFLFAARKELKSDTTREGWMHEFNARSARSVEYIYLSTLRTAIPNRNEKQNGCLPSSGASFKGMCVVSSFYET